MFSIVATGRAHQVALHTSVDGWTTDLSGQAAENERTFVLDGIRYTGGFEFKFFVDGQWVPDDNIYLAPSPGGRYAYALQPVAAVVPRAAVADAVGITCSGVVRSPRPAVFDVDLLRQQVGGEVVVGSARTDAGGRYQISYDAGGEAPDLQARASVNGAELARSAIVYDAGDELTLDVDVPPGSAGLPSEYESLVGVLAAAHPAPVGRLRAAADVRYLAGKSGLDPQRIEQAATAGRLADGDPVMPSVFYYAMLRAGAPPDGLYRIDPASASQVWSRAAERGVIPAATADEVSAAVERFTVLAGQALPEVQAFPGASTVRDLAGRVLDGDQVMTFGQLLARYRTEPDELWRQATDAFGAETADALKLDGTLAYLTLDNAPLLARLHAAEPALSEVADLARLGYHRADRWLPLIGGDVPEAVPGRSAESYVRMLAAQVAVAAPTVTAAEFAGNDEAGQFLTEHHAAFDISRQPLTGYLARTPGVVLSTPARDAITRLQLRYQITPNDDALAALTEAGIGSARDLADQSEDQVVATFGGRLGVPVAKLMHAKAVQVSATAVGLAGAYLTARQAPSIAGAIAVTERASTVPADYPTLAELFGSLDYCACSDCRSVLSPAAYLVDLLQFLDRPVDGNSPQQVLLDRRPDLQHRALTCENTNTVLPYIDVVNETLEYFVAHGLTLDGYLGHDTDPNAASEDLLADPSYVEDAAYTALQAAVYPAPLPFHRPLETVRRYLSQLGTTLADAMRLLWTDRAPAYQPEDVLLERLGISRDQRDVLIGPADPGALYGLPAGTAVDGLRNLALLVSRLRISYDDLTALLASRYVNPDAALLPALDALRISLTDLRSWHDGTLPADDFRALLPSDLDPSPYGGDVLAWLSDADRYARIMGLVLVQPVDGGDGCSLDQLELQRGDGTGPAADTFVRLIRLIRLAGNLGWPIGRTDTAISALLPGGLDTAGLARLGAAVAALDRLATDDLESLLTCWAPMPDPLYDRLFLRPRPAATDGSFDRNADGAALTDATRPMNDAVRAVCNLSPGDWALLVPAGSMLTVATVSAVYARAWLARTLRLSMPELTGLIGRSGLDPFAGPESIAAFLDLFDALRAATLTPAGTLALIGGGAPGADVSALVAALRGPAADPELSGPPDRRQLAIILGPADADFLFGVLDGTQTPLAVAYQHTDPVLGPAIDAAARGRLWYDGTAGRLSYPTMLTPATAQALREVAGVPATFVAAVDALAAASDARYAPFFDRYDDLRDPVTDSLDGTLDQATLLDGILADLRSRRQVQQAEAVTAAALGLSDDLAAVLLRDPAVLPADADPAQPAIQDFLAVQRNGLTLTAPGLTDEAAPVDWTSTIAQPTATWSGEVQVSAAGDYAFRVGTDPGVTVALTVGAGPAWTGTSAPDGRWTSQDVALPAGPVTIELTVQNVGKMQLSWRPGVAAGWQPVPPAALCPAVLIERVRHTAGRLTRALALATTLRLAAGDLVRFAAALADTLAPAAWRATVSDLLTYARIRDAAPDGPADLGSLLDQPDATLTARLGWSGVVVGQLLDHFGLTVADLGRVAVLDRVGAAHALVRVCGVPADALADAVTNDPDPAAVAVLDAALHARFDRVALLAALTAANDELRIARRDALVAYVLQGLAQSEATAQIDTADKLFELLLMDTEMDACQQTTRIRHALSSVQIFVDRCLMGLEAGAEFPRLYRLTDGTHYLYTTSTAERDQAVDGAFRLQGVEGHPFDDQAPGTVPLLRLVNPTTGDRLYTTDQAEATAAAAYQPEGIACYVAPAQQDGTAPLYRLYQDPSNTHLYTTSAAERTTALQNGFADEGIAGYVRIAGQTGISPLSIDSRRWEWMKRYRVWEANRQIFLWRENWLDPELRTDQSAFFRDVMSDLLQGDITDDRATAALITYLNRLEEVAQLEPCGMEVVPAGPGIGDDVLHVVARTSGARRSYFYRRREGVLWTPWEPIGLEIEDNPVQPVVFNGRLFLFWLRVTQKTAVDPSAIATTTTSDAAGSLGTVTVGALKADARNDAMGKETTLQALLCWSEYVNGQWQPAKHSDAMRPTKLKDWPAGVDPFDRSRVVIWPQHQNGNLVLWIYDYNAEWDGRFSAFTFYNSYSEPARFEEVGVPFTYNQGPWRWVSSNTHLTSPTDWTTDLGAGYIDGAFQSSYAHLLVNSPNPFNVSQAFGYDGQDPTNWPFFVADNRRGYFVTSEQQSSTVSTFQGFGRVLPSTPAPYGEPVPLELPTTNGGQPA